MWRWAGLLVCLWGIYGIAQAEPRNHIRVVLDLSKSMRVGPPNGEGNDPGGMAILSTLLLYDLADLDYGLHDSFTVIPFDEDYRWVGDTPPTHEDIDRIGKPIVAKSGGRKEFFDAVKALPYDAKCTHFYPGINKATNDLKTTGKPGDSRTIVVITDGLPDSPTCQDTMLKPQDRELEKRLIENQLVPLLKANKIRLYVLAFGQSVREDFFATMTRDTGGNVLLAKQGEALLEKMLDLFAVSMGYEVERHQLPDTGLQLTKAPRVAVVAFNPKSSAAAAQKPELGLDPRTGTDPARQRRELAPEVANVGKTHSGEPGAGYALEWLLNPNAGSYAMGVNPSRGEWALLRPASAKLRVVNLKDLAKPPAREVMARQDLPLGISANNQVGSLGNNTSVRYKLSAPAIGYTPDHEEGAERPVGGGDVYGLKANSIFPENPKDPTDRYHGKLEAWAYASGGGESPLENLIPYELDVWPYLSIHPNPPDADAESGKLLKQGDAKSCFPFKLEKREGSHMPRLLGKAKKYTVAASIDVADPATVEQEFYLARFEIDGKSLKFEGDPGPASDWAKGQEFTEAELLGEHNLCFFIGQPKSANPSKTLNLPVHFELRQPPYDRDKFDVIERFTYKVKLEKVEPPASHPTLPLWLTAGLLFLLWHRRGQPKLPPDLAFALAPDGADAKPAPRRLGEGSALRRALGLAVEKPIVPASGEEALAWVRPVEGELYRLRLGKGVALEDPDNGLPLPTLNGFADVAVRRPYRLRRGSRAYRVWLEYRA